MQSEQNYFARVTAGLERLVWQDIERRCNARLMSFGHRRIDFAYGGTPATLLDLRGVDDIYVHAARLTGLDHTRASLARLTEKIAPLDLLPALEVCAAVRPISTAPTYRVTASHLGRRNYSRYDVEGAVAAALTGNLPWRFVLNDAEEQEPELDLRVLLEDDWALLGLRLGELPLHRRAYKVASRPGSLKPPVAYCLGLLAALAPSDVVLDPACGAGTILVEAAALVSSLTGLALPADCVYFGEISLSAAVRPVAHAIQRLKEAEKLGFGQAVLPCGTEELSSGIGANAFQPATLTDLVIRIAGSKRAQAED